MLLIGTKNTGSQTVLANSTINLGTPVYRKYCKRTCKGLPTFDATSTGITLNGQGIYHISATFVGAGTVAGALTVQMYDNGEIVTGATSTETITTANTEQRTLVIDYYVKVDSDCVLGNWAVSPKTLTFRNDGVGATFSNVVVNIDKGE